MADLQTANSQMTPDQPVVQTGYGDDHLSLTQGNAGLSAAAVDLARLPAILIDPSDNPVLKRATLTQMLGNALVTPGPRAGYGFDGVKLVNGQFYGQKGGEVEDAAAVLQFNGNTGFIALFGCTAANRGNEIYPDWPRVNEAAANTSWANVDLFPCFNMRSLAPPVASVALPGSGGSDLTDVFLVDATGAVREFSGGGSSGWSSQRITDLWFAPLGAVIATCPELGEDLFLVGSDGALYVLVPQGGGNWNLPLPVSASGFAPPGAGVAAISLASNPSRTDVLVVNLEGQLTVASVTGGGLWSQPQPISEEIFPPGAGVAACARSGVPGETDAFVVNSLGQVCVFTNSGGQWTGPSPINGVALPGAPVAAIPGYSSSSVTGLFFTGANGSLYASYADGGAAWASPSLLSEENYAPGASITVSPRFGAAGETDLFLTGSDGTLWNCSVGAYGQPVTAPLGSGAGFAPPGATVAVLQASLFAVNSASELCLFQSLAGGNWSGPASLGSTL